MGPFSSPAQMGDAAHNERVGEWSRGGHPGLKPADWSAEISPIDSSNISCPHHWKIYL